MAIQNISLPTALGYGAAGGLAGAAPAVLGPNFDILLAGMSSIAPLLLARQLAQQQASGSSSGGSGSGGTQSSASQTQPVTSTAAQNYQPATGINAPAPTTVSGGLPTQQNMPTVQNAGSGQVVTSQGALQNAPSGLSGPANLDPNAVNAAANANNTVAEQSWWDTIGKGLTGEGLQGDALKDWQRTAAMSSLLTSLGSNIAGDHWVGKWGQGMNNFIQGAIANQNLQQAEQKQEDYTNRILSMFGIPSSSQGQGQGQPQTQAKTSGSNVAPAKEPAQTNSFWNGTVTQPTIDQMKAQIRALGLI